jgi:hypothetical protein
MEMNKNEFSPRASGREIEREREREGGRERERASERVRRTKKEESRAIASLLFIFAGRPGLLLLHLLLLLPRTPVPWNRGTLRRSVANDDATCRVLKGRSCAIVRMKNDSVVSGRGY